MLGRLEASTCSHCESACVRDERASHFPPARGNLLSVSQRAHKAHPT